MGLFFNKSKIKYEVTIVGMKYHEENIKLLDKKENSFYSFSKKEFIEYNEYDRIYKYEYYISDPKLVKEPENKHDHDAVAVYSGNIKIGYVARNETKLINKIIDSNAITKLKVYLDGNVYKQYDGDSIEKSESGEYQCFASVTYDNTLLN